jgi:putative Mg2+ transporter-C (MgtC) family protein
MSWDQLIPMPDLFRFLQVFIRLGVAVILGGIVGYEREKAGKAAGFRTHMLVAVGTALFVIPGTIDGMSDEAISRIIQGVAAGLGFLGGGAILKHTESHVVEGLTSAASIWAIAAIGLAVGLGLLWIAILSTLFIWIILNAFRFLEK